MSTSATGYIGENPKFYKIDNKPLVMFESKGKLGNVQVNIIGAALTGVALLVALIVGGILSIPFLAVALYIGYNSVTRYIPGTETKMQSWFSFIWKGWKTAS